MSLQIKKKFTLSDYPLNAKDLQEFKNEKCSFEVKVHIDSMFESWALNDEYLLEDLFDEEVNFYCFPDAKYKVNRKLDDKHVVLDLITTIDEDFDQ